uniref:Ionotropic receptor n=1 Tax=Protaetia brevitarsis TaxID=348688 RepID=A0A411HR65_PROBE|nr:ionotropic receptor [Protaetia brevitarsis]
MLPVQFLIGLGFVNFAYCNSFPSLLTVNATLAVIIDKEYLGDNYEFIKTIIEDRINIVKQQKLKTAGLNVVYSYWTNIYIKKEISVILTVASCKDTWRLHKMADAENILHLAICETDCPRLPVDKAFTIPMTVRGEELPQIIFDLRSRKAYDWKSVILLYDDSLGRDFTTRVLSSLTVDTTELSTGSTSVSLIKLDDYNTGLDKSSIKSTLSTFTSQISRSSFIVIVSMDLATYILQAAQSLELMDIASQWLYVVSDYKLDNDTTSEILSNLKEGNNVAFLNNASTSSTSCKESLDCHIEELLYSFARALDAATLEELELSSQVSDEEWDAIRPTKSERRTYLLNSIKIDLTKNGICGSCLTWEIWTADTWGKEFSFPPHDKFKLIKVGFWKLSSGATMNNVLFPHVVHGFMGKSFSLVTLHNPPWQIIETNDRGGIKCTGLVFDIINELAASLNFTYTLIVLNGEKNEKKNSSYYGKDISYRMIYSVPDGVVRMIRSKQVFMAAFAYTITDENKAVVNFTIPITTQPYTLLTATPKELSRALLFISPFTFNTWLCLLAAIGTMGPILYCIHKISPVNAYHGISARGGLSSISNCTWYIYGALLQQGGLYLPYADSARLLIGSWWLVVLVISTTYCGNLVAFLTFPNNDKPVTTIDELLNQRDTVTWSIAPSTYYEYEIKISNEPKYQALYHGSLQNVGNMDKMLTNIELGKHVHIDWKLRLQYIMKRRFSLKGTCSLSLGTQDFFDERLGLVVSPDNPYLKRINREIKRLHQVGLIEKWLKDYLPKRDKCFKTRSNSNVNNHTVNLDDMQGCFFVLFFGCFISLLLICGERFYHKYQIKRERNIVQPFVS